MLSVRSNKIDLKSAVPPNPSGLAFEQSGFTSGLHPYRPRRPHRGQSPCSYSAYIQTVQWAHGCVPKLVVS